MANQKTDIESPGTEGSHLNKTFIPATQETALEPKLDNEYPAQDAEGIDPPKTGDEKETPGALQQVMTRNEQILTHVL
jgi:hypothetical protein